MAQRVHSAEPGFSRGVMEKYRERRFFPAGDTLEGRNTEGPFEGRSINHQSLIKVTCDPLAITNQSGAAALRLWLHTHQRPLGMLSSGQPSQSY